MVVFRRNADPVPSQASVDFDLVSRSTPIETAVLALAGLVACKASVIRLLIEIELRNGRRQKKYTDAFAKFLFMSTNQLIGSAHQFME